MLLYKIKKIIFRIMPPFVMDFAIYFYKITKKGKSSSEYLESKEPDIIDFKKLYYLTDKPILNIPLNKLRHHGGQAYTYSQNHFMQYFKDGISALANYYNKQLPKTIYEKHFIYNKHNKQLNLPWAYSQKNNVIGEHGLGHEHGHSAFGPVTDKKLKLEANRLDYCLKVIKRDGYLAKDKFTREYNGFPRGYFLVSDHGDWVFRVVGAKHRVAALAHLGWKNIPVCCEPNFPRCIFESDISNWPGVHSGEFKTSEAKLIFDSYFRDIDIKLWQ